MSAHVYHGDLPGYDPQQILHDGCPECEERGRDPVMAINHMDRERFDRAVTRAFALSRSGSSGLAISAAEAKTLGVISAVYERLRDSSVLPISEAARLSVIANKAAGLVRTSNHKSGDELRVVQQWWDGLVEALGPEP
jgi:hypothetical protein